MDKGSRFKKFLYDKPLWKFTILMIVYIISLFIIEGFSENPAIRIPITIFHIILAVYFILVMVNVIKYSMTRLTSSKDSKELIIYYVVFLIGFIIMLSTVLNIIDLTKTGYITYGQCSDHFVPQIKGDKEISHNFFYYTTMLFTVGLGDICPMGLAKEFSMITAIIGHVISVILVALIINNHLKLKEE